MTAADVGEIVECFSEDPRKKSGNHIVHPTHQIFLLSSDRGLSLICFLFLGRQMEDDWNQLILFLTLRVLYRVARFFKSDVQHILLSVVGSKDANIRKKQAFLYDLGVSLSFLCKFSSLLLHTV